MTEWDGAGFEALIIANADTLSERPNNDLIASYYPDTPYTPTPGAHDTLLSIDKARALIGFDPAHSWRNENGRS